MMRTFVALILMLVMMIPAMALAAGPVLLVELGQDAQMVENIEFDDGDFIQTYQLDSVTVQLLRYASFDMSLDELIGSEWTGAQSVTALQIQSIGGCPASGVQLTHTQQGQGTLDVTLIRVDTGAGTLVFEAVAPHGDAQAAAAVQAMIGSMDVLESGASMSETEVG